MIDGMILAHKGQRGLEVPRGGQRWRFASSVQGGKPFSERYGIIISFRMSLYSPVPIGHILEYI